VAVPVKSGAQSPHDRGLYSAPPEDRAITAQLYGGDLEMRLKQEMLLGIGGYRSMRSAFGRSCIT